MTTRYVNGEQWISVEKTKKVSQSRAVSHQSGARNRSKESKTSDIWEPELQRRTKMLGPERGPDRKIVLQTLSIRGRPTQRQSQVQSQTSLFDLAAGTSCDRCKKLTRNQFAPLCYSEGGDFAVHNTRLCKRCVTSQTECSTCGTGYSRYVQLFEFENERSAVVTEAPPEVSEDSDDQEEQAF